MTTAPPVVLILGAGPRVGQSAIQAFAAKGYKVAIAARSVDVSASTDTQLNIPSDFSKPEDVVAAFGKVTEAFGVPSVVIYNAATAAFTPPDDPLSLSLADFTRDLAVNLTSPFVAAQQAAQGFAQLPESAAKTFIYTGNLLNKEVLPRLMSLGIGKSATAHMVRSAAEAYKERGYKFYYADERKEDGAAGSDIDGDAHAKLFVQLAEDKAQGPWLQTFVKGVGYVKF